MKRKWTLVEVSEFFRKAGDSWSSLSDNARDRDTNSSLFCKNAAAQLSKAAQLALDAHKAGQDEQEAWAESAALDASGGITFGGTRRAAESATKTALRLRSELLEHLDEVRTTIFNAWEMETGFLVGVSLSYFQADREESIRLTGVAISRCWLVLTRGNKPVSAKKTFTNMTHSEFKAAVRAIVSTSSSQDEVRRRLITELQYPNPELVDVTIDVPADEVGRQGAELLRKIGNLTTKNGATVSVEIPDQDGDIITLN